MFEEEFNFVMILYDIDLKLKDFYCQFIMLKIVLLKDFMLDILSVVEFFRYLNEKSLFVEIFKIFKLILVFFVINVISECLFSVLKRLKILLRLIMS